MTHIFDISYLLTTFGYIGIFITIFLESGIFPPLPGDSLLFAAGVFGATGDLNIYILFTIVSVASFFGILTGYYVGSHLPKLQRYTFFQKIIKPEYLARATVFFERHGKYAIILSRFVPIVRTFVPITAGMVKMNHSSFIRYSIIGSIIWSAIFLLSGFFLGKVFPQIQDYILYIILGVVAISILPGIHHLWSNRTKS